MTDLSCTDYSDKAIVVRGETKEHKEELKKLGGKYNANLRDGPGWIFSKKNEDKVLAYIASGNLEDGKDEDSPKAKTAKPNVAKHTAVKPVVKSTADLMASVEAALKAMDLKERLLFVSNVTRLASSQPLVAVKDITEPVTKVQVTVKKRSSSSEEESPKPLQTGKIITKPVAKLVADSDAEYSDEEEAPPKRLLR
jgi:hypothetical protein